MLATFINVRSVSQRDKRKVSFLFQKSVSKKPSIAGETRASYIVEIAKSFCV